jgi:hypothetical protein
MDDYDQIPTHLKTFIKIDKETYNTLNSQTKDFLIRNAVNLYDSTKNLIIFPAKTEDMKGKYDDTVGETFDVIKSPDHMNLTDFFYQIKQDKDAPDRADFVNIIRSEMEKIKRDSHYEVVNISVSYVTHHSDLIWLSFSRKNIEEIGLNGLLKHLVEGSDLWQEDFYGGSGGVKDVISTYAINTAAFSITAEAIRGGNLPESSIIEYDYYLGLSMPNKSNNCLIECFKYFANVEIESDNVREMLGIDLGVPLTREHIPKLEELFDIKVCVSEDKRDLAFKYVDKKSTGDFKTIVVKDNPVILYGTPMTPYRMVWKDEHFNVIYESYRAKDCHCPATGVFVGYGKNLSREAIRKELYLQNRLDDEATTFSEEDEKDTYYYFFDYETVYDPNTYELIPYAWSLVKCDDQGEIISKWNDIQIGTNTIIDILRAEAPMDHERKYLIGFNNSRFDNYILVKQGINHHMYINNVMFAGNTILTLNIKGFVVRDLCRIVCTSLEKGCKDFKCNILKSSIGLRN